MTELERDLLAALELVLKELDYQNGPMYKKDDIRLTLRQVIARAKAAPAPAGDEAAGLRAEVARLHAECDRLELALADIMGRGTSSTGIQTESAERAQAALRAGR